MTSNKMEFVEVAKMKLKNPMLVVTDIDKSIEFYKKVFGLHVIMDFVLNHTSDQHPWFQDAIKNPDSIYRDYYIFAGQNNQRPNNWGSFFGGSVWEKDPAETGQFYFHLFDKRMPDLNWNCKVLARKRN